MRNRSDLRRRLGMAALASSLSIATARAGEPVVETALPDAARAAFFEQLNERGGAGGFGSDEKSVLGAMNYPANQWKPWDKFGRVEKVTVIETVDGVTKKVEKYWEELSSEQFMKELAFQYSETLLYKVDKGGNLSFAGPATAGLDAKAGSYKLVFNNFKYRPYPCSEKDPGAGELAVGVGLRITVDAKFKKNGINFGFGPIALSASKEDVGGVVTAQVSGLAGSVTLSTLHNELASAGVTYDNLIKASNLNAVAGAALENMTPITPSIIAFREKLDGACASAYSAMRAGNGS